MATVSIKTSKSFTSTTKIPGGLEQLLEDKDHNGTPDFVDDLVKEGKSHSVSTEEIIVNGQKYHSWDEVPAEFQQFKSLTGLKEISPNVPEKPLPSDTPFFIKDFKLYALATFIVLIVYFLIKFFKIV